MYNIIFSKSAVKELAEIDKPFNFKIRDAIDSLGLNPRPDGVKKLHGIMESYRIRVGDYRIIYTIDDQIRIVKIQKIRHRQEAY